MAQQSSNWEHLDRRLNRLERQNRILKWFVLMAGLAMVVAGLLPGQAPANKTVEANSFILRDQNGTVRASLVMEDGAPFFRLFDSAGRPRVVESVTVVGAGLALLDATGKPRAALLATLTGDPSLSLFDEDGKPRSVMGVLDSGPGLALFDSSRKMRIGLEIQANGAPSVSVADANGKRRAVLSVVSNGNPLIGVLDENEQPRAALGRNTYGDGLVLFGPNAKPAVTMAVYPTGTATGNALTFWDLNAKPRLSLGTFTSADVPGIVASDGDGKVIWKVP